jgi:hypothetical protein
MMKTLANSLNEAPSKGGKKEQGERTHDQARRAKSKEGHKLECLENLLFLGVCTTVQVSGASSTKAMHDSVHGDHAFHS